MKLDPKQMTRFEVVGVFDPQPSAASQWKQETICGMNLVLQGLFPQKLRVEFL